MAGQPILIAAFSGRAAAMAARRAGFAPLVADLFADEDTRAVAEQVRRVEGDPTNGFAEEALLAALCELADRAGVAPISLAYGAGFEDGPDLLSRIAARWPLLGNPPEVVLVVKNPQWLAEMLERLGIPHPEISEMAVARPGWLLKRTGGAGGIHVDGVCPGAGKRYAQRRVKGRSISALFLSSAAEAQVIGFSEQWTAPSPGHPFRFGGAVTPAELDDGLAERLTDAVCKVARATGLRGLNSADFIVGEGGWWLIEINPRLSATIDLFEEGVPAEESPSRRSGALFAGHVAAVRGQALPSLRQSGEARALSILYAPANISHIPHLELPNWVVDRPPTGQSIPADAPLCTILASAQTACEARRLCQARAEYLLNLLGSDQWIANQASA
jgi:predicted ATP-grasp superfamily ATP-dependent carboligase